MLNKVDLLSLVPAEKLFPLIEELLIGGQDVVINARGNSMYPLIRDVKDSVKLTAATYGAIKKGDVTLIQRDDGVYVIHRVCKKTPVSFYMVGDRQRGIEGPLRPDQLIALVDEVRRGGRTIRRGSLLWSLYAHIWLILRPVRRQTLGALSAVRAVTKHR